MQTKIRYNHISSRTLEELQNKFPAIKLTARMAVIVSQKNPTTSTLGSTPHYRMLGSFYKEFVCYQHGDFHCISCIEWCTRSERARTVCKHSRIMGICGICTNTNINSSMRKIHVSNIPGHKYVHGLLVGRILKWLCECEDQPQLYDILSLLDHLDDVSLPYHRARLASVLHQAELKEAELLLKEILDRIAVDKANRTRSITCGLA